MTAPVERDIILSNFPILKYCYFLKFHLPKFKFDVHSKKKKVQLGTFFVLYAEP